jgi:hypothetical protein
MEFNEFDYNTTIRILKDAGCYNDNKALFGNIKDIIEYRATAIMQNKNNKEKFMIKFINLNNRKYCEDDYYIRTILSINGYAIQIIKKIKE